MVIEKREMEELKNRIFNLVQFEYKGTIHLHDFDGIEVNYKNGIANIGYATRSQLTRALFLLAMEISSGKQEFKIVQKPHFKELGVMLSVQTPMTVQGVIRYMENMAALGFNYLLLYMETSYEVKEYPFFGYMRGRYTEEELKRIDAEGQKLGIEVIPCVQMLGHLQDYLRWGEGRKIADNGSVLLVDNEDSYKFIEALARTLSGIFKTKRIHIGFDEARGMGLGRYLKDHSYTEDRTDMFNRHLIRVKEICRKYQLEPMMWSDMPFRLGGSGNAREYDPESVIPESTGIATEGVGMCFWDYYSYDYDWYEQTLIRHQENFPNSDIIFAGGVWVLDNHLMNMPHTMRATVPAMKACLKLHIKSVCATAWGNASNTNHEQGYPGLAAFSEYCYLGDKCEEKDIHRAAEYLVKYSWRFIDAISEFHLGYKNSLKLGSRFIWCDILYGLMRFNVDYEDAQRRYERALAIIKEEKVESDPEFKEYAEKLFEAAILKCMILKDIRIKYKENDLKFLSKVAEELIPELLPLYERIGDLKETLWLRSTKSFSIESVQMEYADMIVRMKYAQKRIRQFLSGEISEIEELEPEILDEGYVDWLEIHAHMRV